jgi:hypothetical protein
MSEDRDDRIGQFLREQAPPARDPVFRLRVLERREQRQFQRRSLTMLAAVLVIILVATFGIRIGGGALETTGALVVGTALAGAYLAFRGRFLRILRRFSI